MKVIISIVFILFINASSTSQSHPFSIRFSYEIETELAEGKISASRAGLLYSLIGDYQNSIKYSDIPISWNVDTLDLKTFVLKDAKEYILDKAQSHQIIIVSENHLKPQHRVFAKQLLPELSNLGFKHLGMETLFSENNSNLLFDSLLMERGYPFNSPATGTYTLEPQMADFTRKAINLKYSLFAYERSLKIKGKDRDEIQADNILNYLEKHPDEKIIILCGFHHAIESDKEKYPGIFWMAKYIKEKSGIDPLTIYQDNFTEKISHNEHPILTEKVIENPSILFDKEGNLVQLSEHVDIEIIHPKTVFKNGRPSWLYENVNYTSVKIDLQEYNVGFPFFLKAYLPNEIDNGVPKDIIEVKHKYDVHTLVLVPGKYVIEVSGKETKFQFDYEVKAEK